MDMSILFLGSLLETIVYIAVQLENLFSVVSEDTSLRLNYLGIPNIFAEYFVLDATFLASFSF